MIQTLIEKTALTCLFIVLLTATIGAVISAVFVIICAYRLVTGG